MNNAESMFYTGFLARLCFAASFFTGRTEAVFPSGDSGWPAIPFLFFVMMPSFFFIRRLA